MNRCGYNYDKCPVIATQGRDEECLIGWQPVFTCLKSRTFERNKYVVAIECYPGIYIDDIIEKLRCHFSDAFILNAESVYKSRESLQQQFSETLTDDPVFGYMHEWGLADYLDERLAAQLKSRVNRSSGLIFIVGSGAALVCGQPDLLLYADIARWEIQQRQRAHRIGNLGLENADISSAELYKNAFFVEWRAADRLRHALYARIDFFIDLNRHHEPRMVSGQVLRDAVAGAARRPFRVVPFFDPGPWGGQWMKQHFSLSKETLNYAWGFDCVPEENSVILRFGNRDFQLPASVLVHEQPKQLLGNRVYERFGPEFPIRFDLLDTMDGGNLSLQVHPTRKYIREHFGMSYTQDESYYILDCKPGSYLYLGLREGVNCEQMRSALERARNTDESFPAEQLVNTWPTKKHDHFPIPAGTIHCSGKDNVVLEISATPYIFTFKLWDWGRTGLDGKPRPIHLQRGLDNIQWNRTTSWVQKELMHQCRVVERGDGWIEEHTGLHSSEFLETRRHWFTKTVPHNTHGNLNVLNLVEGREVVVESPTEAFPPMHIHFGETFIVPAAVGAYTVRPLDQTTTPIATIKAYVRE